MQNYLKLTFIQDLFLPAKKRKIIHLLESIMLFICNVKVIGLNNLESAVAELLQELHYTQHRSR